MIPSPRAATYLALTLSSIGVAVFAQSTPSITPPAMPPATAPVELPAAPEVDPAEVVRVKLPLDLPAIGNIDAVTNWRFGRIESVVERSNSDDVRLRIRIADGSVLETIAPRALAELARQSDWVNNENNRTLSRADYVERMVAFDVDAEMRIIAMISLEPLNRNRRRLQRGL